MAYPQGISFRATSGYVSDGSGDTYEIGTTANYPRTTPQGNTVGWEDAITGTRDRVVQDPRISGIHYLTSSAGITARFRLDLPSAGTYNIYLAAGDAAGGSFAKIELFDTTTSLGVLINRIGSAIPTNSFVDANGVEYTNSTWPTSNTSISKTFASTICRFKLGSEGGGNEVITYLRVEAPAGAPLAATPTAVATATATLTTSIKLAATISSVSTLSADFVNANISATLSSVASVTAALTTAIKLATAISGVSTVTAALTVTSSVGFDIEIGNNTGQLWTSESAIVVNIYNSTTGVLVLRKTGLTSHPTTGIIQVRDLTGTLVAATTYAYEVVLSTNGRILPTAQAV